MAEATDIQMQAYCDQRIRIRAEQFRALVLSCADDKAAIEDVFERASGANPWNDARTDGPPKLLTQQDVLVYNSVVTLFAKFVAGTATLQDVSDFAGNWAPFQEACVQPLET